MNWVRFGFDLVAILVRVIDFLQRSKWYQEGKAAAYAEMDIEQRKRLELAEAARRDADAFNDDPDRLRQDDGNRRD